MVKHCILWSLILTGARAGSFDVSVTTTATQAVLKYTAPTTNACQVTITEVDTGLGVNDVSTSLFAGSNLDSRSDGALSDGRSRTFIAGKRTAEKALNNRYYSRALQAFTSHNFSVNCGGDVTSGSFVTANPPLGNTNPELPGWNPDTTGGWSWPQIDWVNRSQTYIDPLTGILLKRMTGPGDFGAKQTSQFSFALAPSGWTNVSNAISGTTGSLATVTASTAPLFVGVGKLTFDFIDMGSFATYSWAIDDLMEHAFGSGNNSNAANRTFQVCLTVDSGQTCASSAITLVAPQSTAAAIASPGPFPAAPFQRWGNMVLTRNQITPPFGKVTVAGSTVTLQNPAETSYFNLAWPAGTKIFILGSSPTCPSNLCTIASVSSSTVLKIAESVNLTNVDYRAANFGLRVTKTTTTGNLSLSFSYDLAASKIFNTGSNGSSNYCSLRPDTTTVSAAGVPLVSPLSGYLCIAPATTGFSALYFLIPSTGEVRLLSNFFRPFSGSNGDEQGGYINIGGSAFDATDPRTFYGSIDTGPGPFFKVIQRGRYTGDYRAWNPNYAVPPPSDSVTWTNLTPASQSKDVGRQLAAANSKYNTSVFQNLIGIGVLNGRFIFSAITQQDGPCIVAFFNLQTGLLASSADSWSQYPGRWGNCHSIYTIGAGDWTLAAINPPRSRDANVPYQGPFTLNITQVFKSGAWSNDTSLTDSYADTCPVDLAPQWQAKGAVGAQCVKIRVAGEPCSISPAPYEKTHSPCPTNANASMLQTMEEGDMISDFSQSISNERLRIVRKTVNSTSDIELLLQRKAFCSENLPNSFFQHANGWSVQMVVEGGCWGAGWWRNTSGTPNTWVIEDPRLTGSHFDVGPGQENNSYMAVTGAYQARATLAPQSFGQPFPLSMNGWPTFSSSAAVIRGNGFIETYPSLRQWNAPAGERRWILDFRAYQAGAGVGAEVPLALFENAVTLVGGTTRVYRITNPLAGYDRKRLPYLAWAGYHWMHDISGVGSSIQDTDLYSFCVADVAGECRPGSAVGDTFVNVPQATIASPATCVTNHYASNYPCFTTASPVGGSVVQWDITRNDPLSGVNYRRLTMGFSGPGRQYTFSNARSTPDGKWAILPGYWLDGYRMDLLLAKLPPWPADSSVSRADFIPVEVTQGAENGIAFAQARFGYVDNGSASQFYCTSRKEACVTSTSSTEPFLFDSQAPQRLACSSGCTIRIPALPGRTLLYQVELMDGSGNIVSKQPVQATATP